MGQRISINRTVIDVFGADENKIPVEAGDCKIDNADEFECLWSLLTWDNECMNEVRRTIILNES